MKRLAAGGMADVLLARTEGIAGFERHVVIKRIHAELLEEPRYVKMFLDEARLAASLHHHNIVQVNDIGEENGGYFFAMEYVHGEDVRTLLVDASDRSEQIPLEHVVTIITGAAAGLHHAHEQRNFDGTPLHIVHRDVSPANILVGYDGAVKVADFGIALAAHRAEQTQSGVLKGKVAYMSPEQCNCDPVDRRSDVFSLGIVLYELAVVRPCFIGDNDFMTMSAIVGGKIDKPSKYRKDLPPRLEAIIMKALARKPEARYQSADELRVALEEFAAEAGLRTSTTALADYMKAKFGTKALPWQEEDDDPELEWSHPEGSGLPPPLIGMLPRTERPQKPTLPLRPVTDRDDVLAIPGDDALAIPGASGDDDADLSVPLSAEPEPPKKPTLPLRSLDMRPPGEIVVRTPITRGDHRSKLLRNARNRRLWLAGSALAVAIAGLSLLLVSRGDDKPMPRASVSPTEHSAPQPLERPTVAPTYMHPAADDTPTRDKKSKRSRKDRDKDRDKKGEADKKVDADKKWDPDALFPQ